MYQKIKAVLTTLLLNCITVTTSTSLPISTQGRQLLFYGAVPTTQSVRIDIYQPNHLLRRPGIENGLFVLYPPPHPNQVEFPESPDINEIFPTINPNAVVIPTKPESNIPEIEPDAVLISNFRPNDPFQDELPTDNTFHQGTKPVITNRGPNWTFWQRNFPTGPTFTNTDTPHSINSDNDFNVKTSTPVSGTREHFEPRDIEKSTDNNPDDDLDDTIITEEQETLAEADRNPNFPINTNSRFPFINQEHRFYILNGQTQFQSNNFPTTLYANMPEKTTYEPYIETNKKKDFLLNNFKSSYPEFHRSYLSNTKMSDNNKFDIQHSPSSSSSRFLNNSRYTSNTNPSIFSVHTSSTTDQSKHEDKTALQTNTPTLRLHQHDHSKIVNLQNDQSIQTNFANDLSLNGYNQPIFYLRNFLPQKNTGSGPNVGILESSLSKKILNKPEQDINITNNVFEQIEETQTPQKTTLETPRYKQDRFRTYFQARYRYQL